MAIQSVHSETIDSNRREGSCNAFLEAWKEHRRLDDEDVDSDRQDYQMAMFAYEGGRTRIGQAFVGQVVIANNKIDTLFFGIGHQLYRFNTTV